LKKKYKKKEKAAKLFPMPVMTRWSSWKKAADYCSEYGADIVQYACTLSDQVTVVSYFKSLSEVDVNIILTEAAFVEEHCSSISYLLVLLSGNSYPVAHRLYPALQKISSSFEVIQNAEKLKSVLGEKTKSALKTLSGSKKSNVSARIQKVAQLCVKKLNALMEGDPAEMFFKSIATLLNPVKMMTASAECVEEAVKNIPLLSGNIPIDQFQVLHCILKEEVKACKVKDSEKDDVVLKVLSGMLVTENREFAMRCLQLIYFSVSNVECERGFSSYGDIVSPKRCQFLTENAETAMYLYFGDDLSDVE